MTEQTQPTDALAKLRHLYANMVNGGVRDTASAKRIAEGLLSPAIEALEKWGTPAGAGEVVAWGIFDSQGFYEAASDQESAERFCAHYNKRKGADPLKPYTAKPLTTPQPTQAQSGAPRVSPEQWQALFDDQKRLVELANSRADISESMLKAVQVQAGTDAVVEEVANGLRRYGLTLVKTASGYDVLSLREVAAHDTKGADHGEP